MDAAPGLRHSTDLSWLPTELSRRSLDTPRLEQRPQDEAIRHSLDNAHIRLPVMAEECDEGPSEEHGIRSPLINSSSLTSGNLFFPQLERERQHFREVFDSELKKVAMFVGKNKRVLESEVSVLKRAVQACRPAASGVRLPPLSTCRHQCDLVVTARV
jgi:hypothetical protein